MGLLTIVEALLRRDAVRVDDDRTIVPLDVGPEVVARFVVVAVDGPQSNPMTLGDAVAMLADIEAMTLDEAFLVDAVRQSETTASSTYLARVLDRLHALA